MVAAGKDEALITNIQRFSVNDGPGIRTTVFLKGCPLKCAWCHNVECINAYQEFYQNVDKCVRCGYCAEVCPVGAIRLPGVESDAPDMGASCCAGGAVALRKMEDQSAEMLPPQIDRGICDRCMKCVDGCKYGALTKVAKVMPLDEIMNEVKSDRLFYESSGGGLTLAGGEPLFHPEIAVKLLKQAKKEGLNTALDTTGYAKWEVLEKILEYVDLVLLDIKILDNEKHIKWTGLSNEIILSNAKKMAEKGTRIRLRLPIIHSVNYWDLGFPRAVARFAGDLGQSIEGIDIIPFHDFATWKYDQLGRENVFKGFPSIFPEDVKDYEEILLNSGPWDVTIGGMTGVGSNK
ncbi:MAG: hydroxybenzylsuccinate synthase activating enzyme HbsD [Peptococcaceae bacterium BRH_c4a]|nr:MAG: hydroxybenzylsuccinate synthase activating enzyme HbsD [Peptococcaceae bacterium BRH_c4a]